MRKPWLIKSCMIKSSILQDSRKLFQDLDLMLKTAVPICSGFTWNMLLAAPCLDGRTQTRALLSSTRTTIRVSISAALPPVLLFLLEWVALYPHILTPHIETNDAVMSLPPGVCEMCRRTDVLSVAPLNASLRLSNWKGRSDVEVITTEVERLIFKIRLILSDNGKNESRDGFDGLTGTRTPACAAECQRILRGVGPWSPSRSTVLTIPNVSTTLNLIFCKSFQMKKSGGHHSFPRSVATRAKQKETKPRNLLPSKPRKFAKNRAGWGGALDTGCAGPGQLSRFQTLTHHATLCWAPASPASEPKSGGTEQGRGLEAAKSPTGPVTESNTNQHSDFQESPVWLRSQNPTFEWWPEYLRRRVSQKPERS